MALSQLKLQLNELVLSMMNEGIVDSRFVQLQALQDANNPNFMVELMTLYCKDTETEILELTKKLSQKDVELSSIDQNIHRLKGSSSSIGATRMAVACADFREASCSGNKEGCLKALNKMVFEYDNLQSRLQTVIQLETAILDIESDKQLEKNKWSAKST